MSTFIDTPDKIDNNQLFGVGGERQYHNYTILPFPNWRALQKFAYSIISEKAATPDKIRDANLGNSMFEQYVNEELRKINSNPALGAFSAYGLFNKQPKTYKEAMERETFVYWEEYETIKKSVEKLVRDELQKESTAEIMKPKLVFNDKQIGEFVFSKAAMSLQPQLFMYSPSQKREVNADEQVVAKNDKLYLSDGSLVIYAYKVERRPPRTLIVEELGNLTKKTKKIDGKIFNQFNLFDNQDVYELKLLGYETYEIDGLVWVKKDKEPVTETKYIYVEVKGEESLKEATSLGILDCTSENKKVYLYKQKIPKTYKAVKVIVGLTRGGYTGWTNDFYTGITAAILVDILESLGYSVNVEVVMGGGRCENCGMSLNFYGQMTIGRRFFSFTAKSYNEQLDLEGLLYTLCDPSFHTVKWIALCNYFFAFYGDQIQTDKGDPTDRWHGIQKEDLVNPIGMYQKHIDNKNGNKEVLSFYVHRVSKDTIDANGNVVNVSGGVDSQTVLQAVKDIVLKCENMNRDSYKKFANTNFDELK